MDPMSTANEFLNAIEKLLKREEISDIHFLPQEASCWLLARGEGGLLKEEEIKPEVYQKILASAKEMSMLDVGETRLPQDGRIKLKVDAGTMDIRLATLPTIFGEKLTLRIPRQERAIVPPERIFPDPADLRDFHQALSVPFGLVLFCGPTGSGKTTTAYTAVQELAARKILSVHSVEDPIEYALPGVAQTQIQPRFGLDFPAAIKSVLRHDPDVLYVGEVRESQSVDLMLKAVVTGHLVISSLHVTGPQEAVERLLGAGANPALLASALSTVVCQKLLRKTCPDCCQETELDAHTAEMLGLEANARVQEVRGCPKCNHTGYRGRLAVYEFLHLNKAMKDAIRSSDPSGFSKELERQSHRSFREKCCEALLRGETTLEEVLRV